MKVLITRKIPRAGINELRKYPKLELDYRQGPPLSTAELKEAIKDVDAIIPVIPDKITKEVLEAAGPNLKVVAHYAVGYDNIDVEAASEMGIYVTNTPGDLTESVAEFSIALMLAIGKQIVQADRYTRGGQYDYWDPMIFMGPTFYGKTIGIVGMGRIGNYTAKLAKGGFNMNVLYYDNQRHDEAEKEVGAIYTSLEELLEKSDVVSLHVPLLPSTKHLIGERELRKMKPTAFLINTARGPVIDEDALYVALKEKWIEGAAIDVYEDEPRLYQGLEKLENIVLTPHIASATREARIEMARMAVENVIEVLINNKEPPHLVNSKISQPRIKG